MCDCRAVSAEKLAFLTDIEGVYKDPEDPSTLISELTVSDARKLITDGYIGGGMLPKLNNCIDAIENGVSRCAYSRWKNRTLSAFGNLHQSRNRYCNFG